MASPNPINAPPAVATPDGPAARPTRTPDRRLRVEDILKLMVADGLVTAADADRLARSRTQRFDHPLELIADQKWRSLLPPRPQLTLETLVEWLATKLGVPYHHIDPLKIDLVACTNTMSNAYAERYRILPVVLANGQLTVATSEPFVRGWADELEKILHLDIKLVFANPQDIKRFVGEFFTLARSIKKASETTRGEVSLVRNFEQLVELGRHGALDANDQHVVHIVDWLWQYAFEQRASDIHIEPRRDAGIVRFRIDGVLHQVYMIPNPVLLAMTSRIKLLARMEIVEKRRPQDGRIKTVSQVGLVVLIARHRRRRDDGHWHPCQARGQPQLGEHCKAIAHGRVQVEKNGIRDECACLCPFWRTENLQSLLAALEPCHFVSYAAFLQRQFDEEYICGIVFDKHDLGCLHTPLSLAGMVK